MSYFSARRWLTKVLTGSCRKFEAALTFFVSSKKRNCFVW